MPGFRRDPRSVIIFRLNRAPRLRDPLYGGAVGKMTVKEKDASLMRWALLFKWFVGLPQFTYDEMFALPAAFVAEHGVAKWEGPAADEFLWRRYNDWLIKRANAENRREKAWAMLAALREDPTTELNRAVKRAIVEEESRRPKVTEDPEYHKTMKAKYRRRDRLSCPAGGRVKRDNAESLRRWRQRHPEHKSTRRSAYRYVPRGHGKPTWGQYTASWSPEKRAAYNEKKRAYMRARYAANTERCRALAKAQREREKQKETA